MKPIRIALLSLLFFAFAAIAFSKPVVEKVEPPNWWSDHPVSEVRLLVRGSGFTANTRLLPSKAGISVANIRVNGEGTYLFADIKIAKGLAPGRYPLVASNSDGETSVPFEIAPRLGADEKPQTVSNSDIIYLIMPDRFANGDPTNDAPPGTSAFANDRSNPRTWHGGDFRGIIDRLSYLKELGVTAIWLTPWYDNPDSETNCDKPWCPNTNYHGYHAIDYYAVENRFGSMEELRTLVREARKRGIKVIQDQVANHVGHTHPWMQKRPLPNWFSPYEQNTFANSVLLSPNSTKRARQALLEGWFNELLPDLNQYEPEVSVYERQNAIWWIETTGISGIRQDTIQYMPREFIRDWSHSIREAYPGFWMVGEVFERDSAQTAFFQGGKKGWDGIDTELPSVFDFKLWETARNVFTGKLPASSLRDVLKYDGLYPDINNVTVLTNNHDTERFMSLDGATIEGAKLHVAFALAVRGIPQLYYGEEILMAGGHDPFNRDDFPGGWNEDKISKFDPSGRNGQENEMFEWVSSWIRLRRASKAIQSGTTRDLQYSDSIYAFSRTSENEEFVFVFNTSEDKRQSSILVGGNDGDCYMVAVGPKKGSEVCSGKDGLVLDLNPKEAIALKKR
ncbi:MAG: alpha-amylase family glycosyl hydrolase [Pyrinomonadaceae bacterium]